MVLSKKRKTKVLISLCACAGWSAPVLFANPQRQVFSRGGPYFAGFIQSYEGCSNMNASSFIIFFTYMLRQNAIPFWKELFVAFKMAPSIKKHSLYFSSYKPSYKGYSYILKFFLSKLQCTFWYKCGYCVISF